MKRVMTILLVLAALSAAAADGYVRAAAHALPFGGVVTYARTSDAYFFMMADDGTGPWRIDQSGREQVSKVAVGDLVSVIEGESRAAFTTPRINRAKVAVTGHDTARVPPPRRVTIADLYRHPLNDPAAPDLWGLNVVAEGVVRDINRRETFTQIQVSDGVRSFQASAAIHVDRPLPDDLKLGARVAVEGVMLYSPVDDPHTHAMTDFNNVSVMPLDIDGVTVLTRAPFWTPGRLAALVGAILAVLAGVLVWAALLRRAVARKAVQLEETLREKVRDKVEADAIRRERLRFSYELHDNFQQLLASCRFRLETLDLMLPESATQERAQLEKAQTALDYTQHGLRAALWGMTEESEGPQSFTGLLRFAAGRMAHWDGVVFIDAQGREPPGARKFAGLLLMVVQEAVGNALRHGAATRVDVNVSFGADALTLSVADNGCGFDAHAFAAGARPSAAETHLGLSSMRQRVVACGGMLTIDSAPGRGTTVTARVPYDA